ncbi:MAG: hypothetical protein ABIN91_19580 [Mucilaginibacter sp.]|uniref:hypothetical protein n=1 Tax=Mucilaginibacter sp. TaxID=1882438 RepID=UPI003263BB00
MRITLLILLICSSCLTSRAQIYVGQQQGLPYRDTSKHIASMRTCRYRAIMANGKLVKTTKDDEAVFFYDKHGNLVKRVVVYKDKDIKYVKQAAEAEFSRHAFNDSTRVINKPIYDERGNLIMLPHDPLLYNLSGTFKYNDQNQITDLKQIDQNNYLNRTQTFTYNNEHKLTERVEKNFGGNIIEKTTFDYDKAGHVVQVLTADAGHVVSRTKLIYDNISGKLMHLVLIGDASEPPIQYSYEYDNKDRKAQIYMIYGNTRRLYSSFKYDAQGGGYTYTENSQDKTIIQTIAAGTRKREVFDDKQPRNIQEWHFDKRNNITYQMEASYTQPPQKIELANITVVENDIKYRGGIFNSIANWFRAKKYPPRAGGM